MGVLFFQKYQKKAFEGFLSFF